MQQLYKFSSEVHTDNHITLHCDCNRLGGKVACYTIDDLVYDVKFFPPDIEKIFFKLLLPNSKPIVVGNIYRASTHLIFWKS